MFQDVLVWPLLLSNLILPLWASSKHIKSCKKFIHFRIKTCNSKEVSCKINVWVCVCVVWECKKNAWMHTRERVSLGHYHPATVCLIFPCRFIPSWKKKQNRILKVEQMLNAGATVTTWTQPNFNRWTNIWLRRTYSICWLHKMNHVWHVS